MVIEKNKSQTPLTKSHPNDVWDEEHACNGINSPKLQNTNEDIDK